MSGGDIAGEWRQDMAVSRRGKREHIKAEPTLESECDRHRGGGGGGERRGRVGEEGGRAWERCAVESKPPSSPGFSVKDTVLKR